MGVNWSGVHVGVNWSGYMWVLTGVGTCGC